MSAIDFYFDFTSPYAYMAHYRLPALADKYHCTINYKPIDLKAVKLACGNTGPATVEIPLKLRYVMADLMRWVKRYNAPFKVGRESKFESEKANKGTFFAAERGQARDYVILLWRATYGEGGSMGSDELLADVARKLAWSPDEFLGFVQSQEAEEMYKKMGEEAHGRGVFGVPTMIVGEEMWWGNDRLDFLDEYLAANCR